MPRDYRKILDKLSPEARKELHKALTFYRSFHWGIDSDKLRKVKKPEKMPSCLVQLGYLTAVIYATKKKGDRHETRYIHSFDRPLPVLACDSNGKQLYIVGGNYTITADGIER